MAANVFSYLLSYGPKFDQVWIFEAARICWIGTEWPIYGFLYRYRLEQRTAILRTRMLRRWYLFMRICFLIQIHLYIYLVYIQYIIIMAESWFEFCARFSLVYFHFCLAASQDTAKFVCPLYMFIGGALLTPSPAPFPIVFMSLYFLFLGLKNFASFSPVWLQKPL